MPSTAIHRGLRPSCCLSWLTLCSLLLCLTACGDPEGPTSNTQQPPSDNHADQYAALQNALPPGHPPISSGPHNQAKHPSIPTPTPTATAKKLVVYSARSEPLITPLFDAYHKETGVDIEFTTDKAGPLIARLTAEGARTPADVLITVDAGNLWQAQSKGLLKAIQSAPLTQRIPANYRDPEGHWFGLSLRARTIVYAKDRVKPDTLSTYAALGQPSFAQRLCLRTAKKVYNQSLVALMIERLGNAATERIVGQWVNNLATDVFSNDTSLLKAIAAGQCDVGIVNTYYLARLLKEDSAFNVGLFWANQQDSGVHVNVSGAAVVKHSRNSEGAQAFIEWLSSDAAQALYTQLNLEYPVVANIPVAPILDQWQHFKADPLNLAIAGQRQAEAIQLMDRAGYQ